MATLTYTTPQAVSRKLSSLGFKKADETGIGFVVYETEGNLGYGYEIVVSDWGYDINGRSSIAQELIAAGYEIEVEVDNAVHLGRSVTSLVVLGKLAK